MATVDVQVAAATTVDLAAETLSDAIAARGRALPAPAPLTTGPGRDDGPRWRPERGRPDGFSTMWPRLRRAAAGA